MKRSKFYNVDRILEATWHSDYVYRKKIYTRIVAVTGGLHPNTDSAIKVEVRQIAQALNKKRTRKGEQELNVEYNRKVYNRVRDDIRTELSGPNQGYTAVVRTLPVN